MPTSHRTGLIPVGSGHPTIRKFLDIKHNRGSHPPGALALEGLWSIRHAVQAGLSIDAVLVCPALLRGPESELLVAQLRKTGAATLEVSERVLRRMVDRDGPDGLAALAVLPSRALHDIPISPTARVVVADRFELAGNLGTVIRCADGAGAAGVIITERRLRLTHPVVVKASTGTVFSMPIVDTGRADALDWLRASGFRIVAADPASRLSYRDADYRGRVAIVLGSERYGLGSFWGSAADATVSIPMLGVADSLNVGHAAAVLLYEALHGGEPPD
jgi:RNA methyltransferase, TrmH family